MARPRSVPTINAGFRAAPELVEKIDRLADSVGMSRNAYLAALCTWDAAHATEEGTPSWWEEYRNPPQGTLPLP